MEIKVGTWVFTIPDECPIDRPRKSVLRRNIVEHGPLSFLASRKLAPFASCVVDDLVSEGAELVVAEVHTAEETSNELEPTRPEGSPTDDGTTAEECLCGPS